MELHAAISGRRAVREYTDEAVDASTIRALIAAAIQAPSAMNQQPWTFTVVRDRARLERLSREAKQHLLATTPPGPRADHYHAMLDDAGFQIFYHAPVLILVCAASAGPWVVEDCCMAAENLMLAACAAGLGTCWIGLAQAYLATDAGKALLGLPAAWLPVAPIIVGHPRRPAPPVPRNESDIRWVGAGD